MSAINWNRFIFVKQPRRENATVDEAWFLIMNDRYSYRKAEAYLA